MLIDKFSDSSIYCKYNNYLLSNKKNNQKKLISLKWILIFKLKK